MNESITIGAGGKDRIRIGTVPFFNALPLTFGLAERPEVCLRREVPAALAAALDRGELEAALVPVIDYQRTASRWSVLGAGAIGSRGPVMTVKVLSRCRLENITELAADTDSHTSVVLAEVIWRLRYGRRLQIRQLDPAAGEPESVLLIGDKVLGQADKWPYQLDLGLAWHELTGLAFVYAFWVVANEGQADAIGALLEQARREGAENTDRIVAEHAETHGFGAELARAYLTENLCYDFGPDQIEGVNRFYELAYESGLIAERRELRWATNAAEAMSVNH